jgi:hypothetical protein
MIAMSERTVDLSYRGLPLAKQVKLSQVRPTTGYLELAAPMPVGTPIAIATEQGLVIEASVAEVHEQLGEGRTPGMLVRPRLDADAARQWWTTQVGMPELAGSGHAEPAPPVGTVLPKRMTGDIAVPELKDDGRTTAVMAVVDDPDAPATTMMAAVDPAAAQAQDDAPATTMMAAVDLAALGLDPASASGRIPAITTEDDEAGTGDKPDKAGGKRKRKKAR